MNEESKKVKHGGAHSRSFGDLTVRGGGGWRSRSSRSSQPCSLSEGGQSAPQETSSPNKTTEQILYDQQRHQKVLVAHWSRPEKKGCCSSPSLLLILLDAYL